MNHYMTRARDETSGVRMYLLAIYYMAASTLTLTIAFLGLVAIVFGWLITVTFGTPNAGNPPDPHQVLGAVIAIYGAAFVVFGVLSYGVLWTNKKYGQMTRE